ncbi:MAG: hypothetical protein PHG41_00690 [Actinomycetota bacterium]|nr:hypothetical protein [Actinomycetota bacterium]
MALFKKKRAETPKNPLGSVLYRYDIILNRDLKKILDCIEAKKKFNIKKASNTIDNINIEFDEMLADLSKENLKIDYRSDKIRYEIIDMIKKIKDILKEAHINNFNPSEIDKDDYILQIRELKEIRSNIKNKMKDIESDYL